METQVIVVNAVSPQLEAIARAAAVLRHGGLVAFPTETVYGLGASAFDTAAVAKIFLAKGRPSNNPLIVHVARKEQATELVMDWPDSADRLAERFWPGPLTLVLSRSQRIPDIVTAGGPTVALRVPSHPVALTLLRSADFPLAAPSANRSTGLSPTRAEHVLSDLSGHIELILDAGPTPGGLESTVLDLTTRPPRLLRPGLIAPAQIEEIIGPVEQLTHTPSPVVPLRSPGQLGRHYAPRAPLECTLDDGRARALELSHHGMRVGWLTFSHDQREPLTNVEVMSMPGDPHAYGARLYAVLHDLDQRGVERIVVAFPPPTEEWLAIRDRLLRASSPARFS